MGKGLKTKDCVIKDYCIYEKYRHMSAFDFQKQYLINLDSSKQKEFGDDNFKFDKKWHKVL